MKVEIKFNIKMDFGSYNEMEVKVVVIGEARVGKTSLSYKFWAGEFDSD